MSMRRSMVGVVVAGTWLVFTEAVTASAPHSIPIPAAPAVAPALPGGGVAGPDPVEPLVMPGATFARVKSPQQQMHFTAGLPFRFLADGNDPNQWTCPPGHPPYVCSDVKMEFSVDGVLVGTQHQTDANEQMHGWEVDLPNGLSAGDHVLTVRYTPHDPATNAGGTPVDGLVPVTIHVDPLPAHANRIVLTSDIVLSGSQSLAWFDATVIGNGHTVTAAAGYSGTVTVQNSFVTGLAAYDGYSIDVATSGNVDVERSVFEATAPLRLAVSGSASLTVRGNEFRSNNFVTYVLSDPARSPILDLTGRTTGAKIVSGNNIAGGILQINGGSGWQIGGLTEAESNILIGPRAVISLSAVTGSYIQGNYDHHMYEGAWSQGYNLAAGPGSGSNSLLAEYNVLRGGSWLVQSFGGEFRYNLTIDDVGHDTWRGISDGTKIHHNLFTYAGVPNSGYNGMLMTYLGEDNAEIYNNTFDAGGSVSSYSAPAVMIHSGSVFKSVRSNVFVGFSNVAGYPAGIVAGDDPGSVQSADYNDFFNPLVTTTSHYSAGLVTPGGHDKSVDPLFAGRPDVPYRVDEGLVWLRQLSVWQVLAYYRGLYTPSAGSPLIDAGDPSDGRGNDIGAVGAGVTNALDAFGMNSLHPRIWLTSALRTALVAKVAANDPDWLTVRAHADDLLTQTVAPYDRDVCPSNAICYPYEGGGWSDALTTLGLAYQMTGNTAYAAKAIAVMQAMNAAGVTPVTVDSGYPSRFVAAALALAYDWCYDQLDDATKTATIQTLNAYFDWAKANAFDFGPSSSAVGNYFGGHLLGFGLAALATAGENSRAGEINTYVRALYDSIIAPAFAPGGVFQSGYPYEGYVYGTNHFTRLLQYAYAVKTATGEDLTTNLVAPIAHSLVYSLKPNRWQFPDEADYPGSFTGIMDPTLALMLPTLASVTDAAYAQWLYLHLAANPAEQQTPPFARFLWFTPAAPAKDYTAALPRAWYAPGDEHLFTRSNWTDAAVWTSFRMLNAAPAEHQLRGAGNIEIQRGNDYLLVNGGQWKGAQGWGGDPQVFDSRSWRANTLWYQNPWGSDYKGGQGWWGVNHTLAHQETDTYAYVIADLSSPYTERIATGLKKFTRAAVSLLDGNVVVCDHVEAGSPSDLKTLNWHLNPATVPLVAGQTATTTVGGSKFQIRVVTPSTMTLSLHDDPVSDTDPTRATYRVEAVDSAGTTTMDVITVLSAFAATDRAPSISSLAGGGVQVGTRSVVCSAGAASVQVGGQPTQSGPALSVDNTSLQFGGAIVSSQFYALTPPQTVHLDQSGTPTTPIAWTATANQPWLTVSPASGVGSATLTISVTSTAGLPMVGTSQGTITISAPQAVSPPPSIVVNMTTARPDLLNAPFGSFDTPIDNTTGVSGSLAVTGWALDDVDVVRVRILANVGGASAPDVFIGNATFVDGARPDVQIAFPNAPHNTRGGWGYMLLTNFLPGGGCRSVTRVVLSAVADDADGHSTTLGTKTISCDNGHAITPFGAIDTPAQGGTVNGIVTNFGWVLSPGTRRADPPGGGTVQVLVDGAFLPQVPTGWTSRSDLSSLFPKSEYAGIDTALGVAAFDSTTLADGLHTIAWIVTDNSNPPQTAGIGSRFFRVWNGSHLAVAPEAAVRAAGSDLASEVNAAPIDGSPLSVRRGFDLDAAPAVIGWRAGSVTIDAEELDRIEFGIDVSHGEDVAGYLRVGDRLMPLPTGSRLDPSTGTFTWMPGVGFVGAYDLVFVRSTNGGAAARQEVRIVLHPRGSNRVGPAR